MAEPVTREVLSVRRHGPEYIWFYLRVDGMPNMKVFDRDTTWEVDETIERTTAYIYGYDPKETMVGSVRIVGPRDELRNLLQSLGEGTPGKVLGSFETTEVDEA